MSLITNSLPLISVVVPCYNQAQYLDECLQSVLDQTYENWECIIVNDGSPDNTEEVAQKWIQKDSRFKYLYKENGGLSSARNAGIEIANGRWILPLDCDDKIANRYLELAAQEFSKNYSLIYCDSEFFGDVVGAFALPEFNFEEILYQNLIFCSAIFPKSAWETVKGYDTNLIYGREDWEFWINLLSHHQIKVKKLDYVGFFYRRKTQSMDNDLNADLHKIRFSERYIYEKHQDMYEKQFGTYIQLVKKNHEQIQERTKIQRENSSLDRRLKTLRSEINSNFVTRALYRMLVVFSSRKPQ